MDPAWVKPGSTLGRPGGHPGSPGVVPSSSLFTNHVQKLSLVIGPEHLSVERGLGQSKERWRMKHGGVNECFLKSLFFPLAVLSC